MQQPGKQSHLWWMTLEVRCDNDFTGKRRSLFTPTCLHIYRLERVTCLMVVKLFDPTSTARPCCASFFHNHPMFIVAHGSKQSIFAVRPPVGKGRPASELGRLSPSRDHSLSNMPSTSSRCSRPASPPTMALKQLFVWFWFVMPQKLDAGMKLARRRF